MNPAYCKTITHQVGVRSRKDITKKRISGGMLVLAVEWSNDRVGSQRLAIKQPLVHMDLQVSHERELFSFWWYSIYFVEYVYNITSSFTRFSFLTSFAYVRSLLSRGKICLLIHLFHFGSKCARMLVHCSILI